jgi:hypothetical protein
VPAVGARAPRVDEEGPRSPSVDIEGEGRDHVDQGVDTASLCGVLG